MQNLCSFFPFQWATGPKTSRYRAIRGWTATRVRSSLIWYLFGILISFLYFSEQLARRLQEEENQQQEQPSPERSSASQPSRPSGSSSGRPTASANPPSTSTRTKNVRPTVIDLFRQRIRIFLHRKNLNWCFTCSSVPSSESNTAKSCIPTI